MRLSKADFVEKLPSTVLLHCTKSWSILPIGGLKFLISSTTWGESKRLRRSRSQDLSLSTKKHKHTLQPGNEMFVFMHKGDSFPWFGTQLSSQLISHYQCIKCIGLGFQKFILTQKKYWVLKIKEEYYILSDFFKDFYDSLNFNGFIL